GESPLPSAHLARHQPVRVVAVPRVGDGSEDLGPTAARRPGSAQSRPSAMRTRWLPRVGRLLTAIVLRGNGPVRFQGASEACRSARYRVIQSAFSASAWRSLCAV